MYFEEIYKFVGIDIMCSKDRLERLSNGDGEKLKLR